MRLNNTLRREIRNLVNLDLLLAKKSATYNIEELVLRDSIKQLPDEVRHIWTDPQVRINLAIRRGKISGYRHYGDDYQPSHEFQNSLKFMRDENQKIKADLDTSFNIDGLESILQSYTTVELLINDYPRFEKYTKVILA